MQHFLGVKIIWLFGQQQNKVACLPTVSRGSAPRIPDLNIRWRLLAIHALAALSPGKQPTPHSLGGLRGPQSGSGRFGQ